MLQLLLPLVDEGNVSITPHCSKMECLAFPTPCSQIHLSVQWSINLVCPTYNGVRASLRYYPARVPGSDITLLLGHRISKPPGWHFQKMSSILMASILNHLGSKNTFLLSYIKFNALYVYLIKVFMIG